MQKYRRWTDEKVGINPFVVANTRSTPLVGRITQFPIQLIKLFIFLSYLPIFIAIYLIPVNFLRKNAARLLLFLFGVYQIEDYSLEKAYKQNTAFGILSNHCCFLDIVYYLYRFPGCHFLGFAQNAQNTTKYRIISPLKAFLLGLVNLQPFYVHNSDSGYTTVGQAIKVGLKDAKTTKLVIFYEKIRTNGRGTIKIDKSLCDNLYELGQDFLIAQMNYSAKKDELYSLTTSGISVVWASLGFLIQGNNLKIRGTRQNSGNTHSSNELKEAVYTMSSGPLLQTSPASYFQFLEFFKKTQKEGYKLQ